MFSEETTKQDAQKAISVLKLESNKDKRYDLYGEMRILSPDLVEDFINIYPSAENKLIDLVTLSNIEAGQVPDAYTLQSYVADLPRFLIQVASHYYTVKTLYEEAEAELKLLAEEEIMEKRREQIKSKERKEIGQITQDQIKTIIYSHNKEDKYIRFKQIEFTYNILDRVLNIITYMTKNFELLIRIEEILSK